MCGYARRHISNKDLSEFVRTLELAAPFRNRPDDEEPHLEHFRPAFGGAVHNQIKDLIIQEGDEIACVDATWWYECGAVGDTLAVNNTRTTFNARNLASPYWKSAIRRHRGIALVTAIGEGKMISGKNRHFFVEGETPLLMGAVYRPYPNGMYSTAIITRDAHLRFDKYHDKAFPLFLPPDPQFLKLWLSDAPETEPAIADLLANPKIFNRLKITPVKTFKDTVATGETEILEPDDLVA